MYLLGREITVEWEMDRVSDFINLPSLSVLIIKPDGSSDYLPGTTLVYVPPYNGTRGSLTYRITPDIQGLWRVYLTAGNSSNYQVLSRVNIQVFGNITDTPNYHVHIPYEEPVIVDRLWHAVDFTGFHHPEGQESPANGQAVWVPSGEYWYNITYYSYFQPKGGWQVGARPTSVTVTIDTSEATADDCYIGLEIFNSGTISMSDKYFNSYNITNNFTASTDIILDFSDDLDILHLTVTCFNYVNNVRITGIEVND